jgi:hypothetical protein
MREDGMTSRAVTSPATGLVVGAGNRASASPRVGIFPAPGLLDQGPETTGAFLERVAEAGIDHVCCGDRVSFFVGMGFDGLVQATALAVLHPALPVCIGVYLLPLRHPVLVARQLADIDRLAPGRRSCSSASATCSWSGCPAGWRCLRAAKLPRWA